jgi:hypothetical protein
MNSGLAIGRLDALYFINPQFTQAGAAAKFFKKFFRYASKNAIILIDQGLLFFQTTQKPLMENLLEEDVA